MKTVLIFAGLVAVALAGVVPEEQHYDSKNVDQEFILRQQRVFLLLEHITQINPDAEYYRIGKEYKINHDSYTNVQAVEEFLAYYRHGFLPWGEVFSVYNDEVREQAIALYHLFYFAKDFDTFYQTAAWARVHLNEGMFVYSFSIAVIHRADTKGIVLPAPYETYPYYFVNSDVIVRAHGLKMQDGVIPKHIGSILGISQQDDIFTINANYSGWLTYENDEQRLSYFTEDIGLNTYYYYFHASMPFWMNGQQFGALKERRGEVYFNFYQQLLARYYMERLSNGLGEIPELSWRWPIKTGYKPNMVAHSYQPFAQRNNYYQLQNEEYTHELQYLESYERQFIEYLEQGRFRAYNWDVNMLKPKSINFVGNYWNSNYDLYEKNGPKNYEQYYELLAHVLLGAGPEYTGKYRSSPVALEQYATALRDPVFFQLYKRILYYFLEYKQYLEPYTREQLHFTGVQINDVTVDRLVTYYDYFYFNATNAVFYSREELKDYPYTFLVRQPRLDHKEFNINIDIKSEVANDAIVKIFLAPKYDSLGHEIPLEENWMHFYELDQFHYKLVAGENKIHRQSSEFLYFKEDSLPTSQVQSWLASGKVPQDMSDNYFLMPERLMLPKGTKGGFPFQFFVMVYPQVPLSPAVEGYERFFLGNQAIGYPFDRPTQNSAFFTVPNMYFRDVVIYHEGEENVYRYNVPEHMQHLLPNNH